MSHLISIEFDDGIAKQILKDLENLPTSFRMGIFEMIENLSDLIFAIEEAIDSDDG